ncbi:exosome complex protein Rrp42 [Candidatus Woesearchaeota archaeon]|nr:exosome complex protein Rrp42 [Candidatus Woesearchaeota archaeon]
MNILKKHLYNTFDKGFREDGRKFDETREIFIEYGISSRSAEGSARVKIGETEVVAGVKFGIGSPFPDKPGEGSIVVNAELLPLASPDYDSGPPSIDSIEISRVVDRAIRESKCINMKSLCVKSGESVWLIFIDIYPINNSGNIFDAAALASLAALKDAKFPSLKDGVVDYKSRTKKGIGIVDYPISCTVRKIGSHLFVDPNVNEDLYSDARLTASFTSKNMLCSLQKGGNVSVTSDELFTMLELAKKTAQNYRKVFGK